MTNATDDGHIPTRKVVQITVAATTDDDGRRDYLYALCNDGTIWRYAHPSQFTAASWSKVLLPPECSGTSP
jgi:hypothetical protein